MSRKITIRTISLREELAKEIEKRSQEENRTFSNMIETILLKEFGLNSKKNNLDKYWSHGK